MEENFESNPLYKDVENYLSNKDALNLKRQQEKRAQRIKLIKDVLSIALPILLSLAVLVTIIFNPLKLSLPKPNPPPVISNLKLIY